MKLSQGVSVFILLVIMILIIILGNYIYKNYKNKEATNSRFSNNVYTNQVSCPTGCTLSTNTSGASSTTTSGNITYTCRCSDGSTTAPLIN